MPKSERNTTTLLWASFKFRQVSVNGFQLMRRPASVAGDAGTACASSRPSTAKPKHVAAT